MRIVSLFSSTLAALVAVATLGVLGVPSRAQAATITLGDSSPGTFQFHGSFGGGLGFVTTGTTAPLTGTAFFDGEALTGTYTLGSTAMLAGPEVGGLFPAGANTQSFDYLGLDGDHLAGTIHWTTIQDNTSQPRFFGNLTITTLTGDSTFLSNFSIPFAFVDFSTDPLVCDAGTNCSTLNALVATNGFATASISSGEIRPTPLPGALPLFAGGLAGLWALGKKRKKQKRPPPGVWLKATRC